MPRSVGGQGPHDPKVRGPVTGSLAGVCLEADCVCSTYRIYTVHHRGDRPRECERCHGKARCPTSKKTKPTARLWCLCGWGPYPAGAISRLNLVASALYRSPIPVLLVSTNLGLQRKSRLRLCICVLISSSRRVPCSVPCPGGDGDRPPDLPLTELRI